MTKDEMKMLADGMIESSKIGTANGLSYIKGGFEAFKECKIPVLSKDGDIIGFNTPYVNKGVRELVDFMIIWLDEAIKQVDESRESNKDKRND